MTTKGEAIAVGIAQVHGFCIQRCLAPAQPSGLKWRSESTAGYLHQHISICTLPIDPPLPYASLQPSALCR